MIEKELKDYKEQEKTSLNPIDSSAMRLLRYRVQDELYFRHGIEVEQLTYVLPDIRAE